MNLPKPTPRWVLLIDKIESGPYDETEVHALLDEGLVRPNDIAYSYPSETPSPDWRFLWQFPPFERRRDDVANEKEKEQESEKDRRQPEAEPERSSKVRAIAESAVRIPNYDRSGSEEGLGGWKIPAEESEARDPLSPETAGTLRMIAFLGGIVVLGGGVWFFQSTRKPASVRPNRNPESSSSMRGDFPPATEEVPVVSAPPPMPTPGEALPAGFPKPPPVEPSEAGAQLIPLVPVSPALDWPSAPPPEENREEEAVEREFDPHNSMNPFHRVPD